MNVMKHKHFDHLTREILEEYGNRKREGRLSVVTDLNNEGRIYPVPIDTEHIEFCTELVGDPRKLERIIPSHIEYHQIEGEYEIISVITGESGMELGYGITHNADDTITAHSRVINFINDGYVLVNPNLELKLLITTKQHISSQ